MYGYNNYPQQLYPMQGRTELPKVNGLDGARAYPMPPNSTAAAFDASDDIMYIIKTDSACYPSVRRFSFTEIFDSPSAPGRDDQIIKVLNEIKEMLSNNGKQPVRNARNESSKSAE